MEVKVKMIKKIFFALIVCFSMAGCATQQFTAHDGSMGVERKNSLDNFFIGGIGQEVQVNAADLCEGSENIARVERQRTFLNGLIGILSSNIWTPLQSKVYCKSS
jgi:uncharacterized lipoprotein YajG